MASHSTASDRTSSKRLALRLSALALIACLPNPGCDDDPTTSEGGALTADASLADGSSSDGACEPGAQRCATPYAAKICDEDGSGWVVTPCADGKACRDGACVRDIEGAQCDPGRGVCASSTTRLRCLPEGRGFESFTCPATAPCSDGECRGPLCVVGTSACSANGVRTCSDGLHFSELPCPSGTSCRDVSQGDAAHATCVGTTPCTGEGQRRCGDPTDPLVDPNTAYSVCSRAPDGSLSWLRIDCAAPATCSPSTSSCSTTCVPGEKRCAGELATQECGPNGEWLPAHACNVNPDDRLSCRQTNYAGKVSADCADEVCALLTRNAVLDAQPSANGVCDGEQFRRCTPDGKLEPAKPCEHGSCRALAASSVAGYRPGVCTEECSPGERRCVRDGAPLVMTCRADGTWSSSYDSCQTACESAVDQSGKRIALCDGACLPGSTRCDGPRLQACGADGHWQAASECKVGRCAAVVGGALCRADCVPGSTVCTGDERVASDGLSTGRAAVKTCDAHGLLPDEATPCPATQTCRTTASGTATGCIECLGPSFPGGNSTGLVDTRCNQSLSEAQVCGADNTWTSKPCAAGQTCFLSKPQTCGTCLGIPGQPCTDSSLSQRLGGTCGLFGLGVPKACGSHSDCCASACASENGGVAFCAPKDFVPCLPNESVRTLSGPLPIASAGNTVFASDHLSPTCTTRSGLAEKIFTFTAPKASTYVFDTLGSPNDTVLYLLDTLSCSELACNERVDGTTGSRVVLDLAAGQPVAIVVESAGDFNLRLVDRNQIGCGNAVLEAGESCEVGIFGGRTCASLTFGERPFGALACSPECTIDLAGCTASADGGGGTGGVSF